MPPLNLSVQGSGAHTGEEAESVQASEEIEVITESHLDIKGQMQVGIQRNSGSKHRQRGHKCLYIIHMICSPWWMTRSKGETQPHVKVFVLPYRIFGFLCGFVFLWDSSVFVSGSVCMSSASSLAISLKSTCFVPFQVVCCFTLSYFALFLFFQCPFAF